MTSKKQNQNKKIFKTRNKNKIRNVIPFEIQVLVWKAWFCKNHISTMLILDDCVNYKQKPRIISLEACNIVFCPVT